MSNWRLSNRRAVGLFCFWYVHNGEIRNGLGLAVGWGFWLAYQAIDLFDTKAFFGASWEKRQLDKRMGRDKRNEGYQNCLRISFRRLLLYVRFVANKTGALYDNTYKAETSASAFPERHSQNKANNCSWCGQEASFDRWFRWLARRRQSPGEQLVESQRDRFIEQGFAVASLGVFCKQR